MSFQLKNKNVLITGASRGIGKSIAEAFAKEGANVAFTFGSSVEAAQAVVASLEGFGVKSKAYQADAVDFTRAQEVIDDVVKEFGSVDVLVNNAGITRDGLLLRMGEEAWDAVINTNLKSVFNYSKAVARPMMKSKGGSVINVSSIIGITGNAGQSNYAASKAGIIGFTKSFAKELASRNIRANVVAPGYILTEMTDALGEKALESINSAIPMGRGGEAIEVANATLFLASELSSYITGSVLQVDGGMAM